MCPICPLYIKKYATIRFVYNKQFHNSYPCWYFGNLTKRYGKIFLKCWIMLSFSRPLQLRKQSFEAIFRKWFGSIFRLLYFNYVNASWPSDTHMRYMTSLNCVSLIHFNEVAIKIPSKLKHFHTGKCVLEMSSASCRPLCSELSPCPEPHLQYTVRGYKTGKLLHNFHKRTCPHLRLGFFIADNFAVAFRLQGHYVVPSSGKGGSHDMATLCGPKWSCVCGQAPPNMASSHTCINYSETKIACFRRVTHSWFAHHPRWIRKACVAYGSSPR